MSSQSLEPYHVYSLEPYAICYSLEGAKLLLRQLKFSGPCSSQSGSGIDMTPTSWSAMVRMKGLQPPWSPITIHHVGDSGESSVSRVTGQQYYSHCVQET